jgi:flagellar basal-body rod protein FlgB
VSQIYLLQLASQQAKWLSERQTIVAGNIANTDTPGYKAEDIVPFQQVLDQTQIQMRTTNPLHLTADGTDAADGASAGTVDAPSTETTVSGNSVSPEQELIKEGDINRNYALNTSVSRIFHQMILSSLK